MTPLNGKIALVTGGSRGLGRNAAERLAEAGADVVITYVRNAEDASDVERDLERRGVRAAAVQLDLSGTGGISAFTKTFQGTLRNWRAERFDILVNNAGISSEKPFGEITDGELDRLFETNFKSLVMLTQGLVTVMNDGGRIITMGTGLTRTAAAPGMVVYAAMKSAVETFTRYLAQALGPRGITANVVAPGGIDNDFNAARFEAMPQMRDAVAGQTALGRIGRSEDIGPITAFLASDAAGWISGQRIEASGGFRL